MLSNVKHSFKILWYNIVSYIGWFFGDQHTTHYTNTLQRIPIYSEEEEQSKLTSWQSDSKNTNLPSNTPKKL